MSQYSTDLEKLEQHVADVQAQAAEALEWLRIKQAHPEIKFNMAVEHLISEYFAGDPITLQDFENAYAIDSLPGRQTLRNMIEGSTPQTVVERNAQLRTLSYEELQQKAREEALVKEANKVNPVVPQVPAGTPILPAHWNKSLVKRMTNEEIHSARIRFDREHGQRTFNAALTYRINGQDKLELKRLYGIGE